MRPSFKTADATPEPGGARRFRPRGPRGIVAAAGFGSTFAGFATSIASLSLVACGGPASPTRAPAVAGSASPVAIATAPDLGVIREPIGLVVSGRFARPSVSLATVNGWSKRPMPGSEQVTELLIGEALGPLVDLDQPVDFAVATLGSGARMRELAAVSLAVKDPRSAEAALLTHHKLVPVGNGALLVEGLGRAEYTGEPPEDHEEDDGRVCELAPAFGPASVRLVCGKTTDALVQLAPWLTRTAVRAVTTSDLHVDVRTQPVQEALSTQKRLFSMVLASVLAERSGLSGARPIASSLASDLVDFTLDIDSIALDVASTTSGDATAVATLRLTGAASTLGRVVTAHPERSAPPPAVFWQMPGAADVAFFGRGADDTDLARVRDLIVRAFGDRLAELGLNEADRQPVLNALGKLSSSAPVAYAGGADDDAVSRAVAAVKRLGAAPASADLAEARRATAEALFGWHILAIDEPSTRLEAAVKELALAWSRPAVVAAYQAHGRRSGSPPVLRALPPTRTGPASAAASRYLLEVPLADEEPGGAGGSPSAGAPRADPTPKSAGARSVLALHVLVVPDGTRTWLGVGVDDGRLAAKLATAMGAPGATLATRADLAMMKDATMGLGGFATLRGFSVAAQLMAVLSGTPASDRAQRLRDVSQRPNQVGGVVVFSWSAESAAPARLAVANVRMPRAAVEDLLAAAMRLSL